MALPRLVVTGASGFVGRHLLAALQEDFRIFGIARRSQARSGAPRHPNISWSQVDIGDRPGLKTVFDQIASDGGADTVVHLAAHYDFTGQDHPEYTRTNVEGLRNVLDLSKEHRIRHFVFSSSVAASRFPSPGRALDEDSPADGDHVYARTKRIGEEMLGEYRDAFPSTVVRFAAMFSDWCEYPPLFMFLLTWLSPAWNRGILGGHGRSAIPYLHVNDAVSLLRRVLDLAEALTPGEVLVASPDGATSHEQLFEAATLSYFGARKKPFHVPKVLCGPGMAARDLLGRLTGERPFEQPWMARYIDLAMTIDAKRTRERLSWAPRPRLEILRRFPFLIENLKTNPVEWHHLNRAAMKRVELPENLRLYALLERHQDEIVRRYSELLLDTKGPVLFPRYRTISPEDQSWNHRVVLRHLMNAVRTKENGLLVAYCRDLAARRFEQGFEARELCGALEGLNVVCFRVLRRDPESEGMRPLMLDLITMALRCGCDQVQEVYEEREERKARDARLRPGTPSGGRPTRQAP